MGGQEWRLMAEQPGLREELARRLGISPLLAQLLINRGQRDPGSARAFLEGSLDDLTDSRAFPGMHQAVAVIARAAASARRVLVYGDYDVDGVTATALLLSFLQELGITVGYYLPDRLSEGYGLHKEALARAKAEGYELVVTVDCGLAGYEEVAWAKDNGLAVIITDHHRLPAVLPPADALVYPPEGQQLSGVGVAFHLARALAREFGRSGLEEQYLDLAALGTVADAVPLVGDNRVFARLGLPRLEEAARPGLRALAEVSGAAGRRLDPRALSFTLVPRLNAPGRMGRADLALRLLLAAGALEAGELAQALERLNQERQGLELRVLVAARQQAEEQLARGREILILASEDWHPGVLGIVAARLAEEYRRPVVLLAVEGGEARGSGRALPGVSLFDLLAPCRELFTRFGGHDRAVGVSLPVMRLEELRERLAGAKVVPGGSAERPPLLVEAVVQLGEVGKGLAEELARLEPFGEGNPRPLLAVYGVSVPEARAVGREGEHLRMIVEQKGELRPAVGFGMGGAVPELAGRRVDLAFSPMLDSYNGEPEVVLQLVAWRRAATAPGGAVSGLRPSGGLEPQEFFAFWAEFARRLRAEGGRHLVGVTVPVLAAYLARWLREIGVEALSAPGYLRRAEVEVLLRRLEGKAGWVLVTSAGLLSQHASLLGPAATSTLVLRLGDGENNRGMGPERPDSSVVDVTSPLDWPDIPAYWFPGGNLRPLIRLGRPLLVYVRGWQRAEALAVRLRREWGNSVEVGVYHHRLPDEAKQRAREAWEQGLWQILVGTPAAAVIGSLRPGKAVLFLYPPFSRLEYGLCALGAAGAYLGWPRKEEAVNQRFLSSLWPPAGMWKTLGGQGGPPDLRSWPPELLRVAAAVVEELRGQRAVLTDSWRYAEARAAWKSWREFLDFARRLPLAHSGI